MLSMSPLDPVKTPFTELRCVVPVRLTTDPWSDDGTGPFGGAEYSVPSTPEEGSQSGFEEYREPQYLGDRGVAV